MQSKAERPNQMVLFGVIKEALDKLTRSHIAIARLTKPPRTSSRACSNGVALNVANIHKGISTHFS